jgi:predicted nucleic acid-binding protein
MTNVFIDTNVLLDVLARREPFYPDSAAVWALAESGKIKGLISAVSVTNTSYIVRRLRDARTARRAVILLRDVFTPVAFDEQVINQAIDSGIPDFEDAVQYFSAVRAKADCIVSRNPSHFPRADPPVLTPTEFLAAYSFE